MDLANAFTKSGWDYTKPVLIGYPWEEKIQLLSGSHRWAAAVMAELPSIPVIVHPLKTIQRAWGTDQWLELMKTGDRNQ